MRLRRLLAPRRGYGNAAGSRYLTSIG